MWAKKTYEVHGDWKIEEKNGETFFVLEDNFNTGPGPDLKLYLSKVSVEDMGSRDPIDIDGVYIAELDSASGAQEYKLPSDVNVKDFKSIAIHCKAYSVVWGAANLG